MANSSFWGRKHSVTSGIFQGSGEAGHGQVSVPHSGSEQWGISYAGAARRGWASVHCLTPNSPTPNSLCFEKVATGNTAHDVLIQSIHGGLCFFLPLLK